RQQQRDGVAWEREWGLDAGWRQSVRSRIDSDIRCSGGLQWRWEGGFGRRSLGDEQCDRTVGEWERRLRSGERKSVPGCERFGRSRGKRLQWRREVGSGRCQL